MDKITEKINEIITKVRDRYREKEREITVSRIATCLRASYYTIEAGKEMSEKMIMGTELHTHFQRYLKEEMSREGYECYSEYELKHEKIKGRADMVCIGSNIGMVIELKFTSMPYKTNPFYPFWYRQLQIYVALAKKELVGKWKGVLIASSFDLSTWLVDVIDVQNPGEVLRTAEERYELLKKALETNAPPPPEKGKWCMHCSFFISCLNQKLM